MDEIQVQINQALDFLELNYPDVRVNNSKRIVGRVEEPIIVPREQYIQLGMKQSRFRYVIYDTCMFQSVALTGSQFHSVSFRGTALMGSSLACCDFYDVDIDGTGCTPYSSNNLSLGTFELCRFRNLTFSNSGILGSMFHNCKFDNIVFLSSTLEGTRFINCNMLNCDFSSVNVEFTQFSKSTMESVCFPFYQFPYVIGAADYISDEESNITIQAGTKRLSVAEYKEQLQNLILYFRDKNEFFPICNLCIANGAIDDAQRFLLDGISNALEHRDFRMIRYFCQLALHHNILNEFTRQRILHDMEEFLLQKDIPETQLNYYMTYIGNIRTMLHGGSSESVALHFNIKTNVQRNDTKGVQYVNTLMNELNRALSQNMGQDGFELKVANFSPYNIAIDVISVVGSAASIASGVWTIIEAVKSRKTKEKQVQIDTDIYCGYVDTKIENLRLNLLRLQSVYSKKKFSRYIDEVTQQLKTDLEELYKKDIMIFKVKNGAEDES